MSRYTDAENEHLRSLYQAGQTIRTIADTLGRSYYGVTQQISALIARGYLERRKLTVSLDKKLAAKKEREIRAAQIEIARDRMRRRIESGDDRWSVICEARSFGVPLPDIAHAYGLSRERVRQISESESPPARSGRTRLNNSDPKPNRSDLSVMFATTDDPVETMRDLFAAGESVADLARASGIGYPRAYHICTSEHAPPARIAKGSVTISTWVGLTKELISVAELLGNGNVSAGVRRALELASNKQQD